MACRLRDSAAAAGGARSAPATALGAGGVTLGPSRALFPRPRADPCPVPLPASDSAAPQPRTPVPGARKTPAISQGCGGADGRGIPPIGHMTAGALPNERAEADASWSPGGGRGGSGSGREAGGARRRQVKAEAGLWLRDSSVARAGRTGERRWVGADRPTGGAARRYRPTGSGIGTGTGAATALPPGCGESR